MLGTVFLTRLKSWLYGDYIGEDELGNKYYRSSHAKDDFGRESRWVVFKGEVEASRVSARWHGWLHHTVAEPPLDTKTYSWQKEHLPNLSGTDKAYRPSRYKQNLSRREDILDYQPWCPQLFKKK